MKARELKKRYLEFFREKSHAIIQSTSLVPENDPTVLFTTAGMHPLVPYLLGQPHPLGKRLANVQKCLRTDDIDEVGDAFHHTFFEMLGNWSLGDYFKEEAIKMSYEFLTSKKWLGIDPSKLCVTVFAGDSDAPRDEESAKMWQELGIPKERIFYNPKKDNWWGPAGRTGPCGPDTEMFVDSGKQKCSPECKPGCSCGKYFEIWNNVFMQYNKNDNGNYELLEQKNVDTGMGVERTAAILQGKDNNYDTELFKPIIDKIKELSGRSLRTNDEIVSARIIADHLRAATFVLGDDAAITPSNVERGYILRRLIRRAIRRGKLLEIQKNFCKDVAEIVVKLYGEDWPELERNKAFIYSELESEEKRFNEKLESATKKFNEIFEKNKKISGKSTFLLFQSYGLPLEVTKELLKERGSSLDADALREFETEFQKHQELSRLATEKIFKSGLADHKEETIKLHTATHLLHAALRLVLGPHVKQSGSNITAERLRFDFSHNKKMTPKELKEVEDLVNEQIIKGIPVVREEMSLAEALKKGAIALFEEKYEEKVSVYSISDFSKEVCAGPHVDNTSKLGRFKILKEEASAAGVRRIKAILEKTNPAC